MTRKFNFIKNSLMGSSTLPGTAFTGMRGLNADHHHHHHADGSCCGHDHSHDHDACAQDHVHDESCRHDKKGE